MSSVFVIDAEGNPLLPTHPARARKLLREGKAKLIQVVPFAIQLNRAVSNPAGSFKVGVDDGAKVVGGSVVNEKTDEVVFRGEIRLRQDVSRLVTQRREYRRARRGRTVRCRSPRFDNRIGSSLAPSIRCRKDSIVRFLMDMAKRVNIVKVRVEEVSFNHAKHKWGKNFSLVEQGKNYLRQQIENLGFEYEATAGWKTRDRRLGLGLSKTHANDAIAMVCVDQQPKISSPCYIVLPRRSRVWEGNPTKTCDEKNGFRHFDLVRAMHRTRGKVVGSIRSLKAKVITLRTKWDDSFPVSYSKTKLLQRFAGLVYLAG